MGDVAVRLLILHLACVAIFLEIARRAPDLPDDAED